MSKNRPLKIIYAIVLILLTVSVNVLAQNRLDVELTIAQDQEEYWGQALNDTCQSYSLVYSLNFAGDPDFKASSPKEFRQLEVDLHTNIESAAKGTRYSQYHHIIWQEAVSELTRGRLKLNVEYFSNRTEFWQRAREVSQSAANLDLAELRSLNADLRPVMTSVKKMDGNQYKSGHIVSIIRIGEGKLDAIPITVLNSGIKNAAGGTCNSISTSNYTADIIVTDNYELKEWGGLGAALFWLSPADGSDHFDRAKQILRKQITSQVPASCLSPASDIADIAQWSDLIDSPVSKLSNQRVEAPLLLGVDGAGGISIYQQTIVVKPIIRKSLGEYVHEIRKDIKNLLANDPSHPLPEMRTLDITAELPTAKDATLWTYADPLNRDKRESPIITIDYKFDDGIGNYTRNYVFSCSSKTNWKMSSVKSTGIDNSNVIGEFGVSGLVAADGNWKITFKAVEQVRHSLKSQLMANYHINTSLNQWKAFIDRFPSKIHVAEELKGTLTNKQLMSIFNRSRALRSSQFRDNYIENIQQSFFTGISGSFLDMANASGELVVPEVPAVDGLDLPALDAEPHVRLHPEGFFRDMGSQYASSYNTQFHQILSATIPDLDAGLLGLSLLRQESEALAAKISLNPAEYVLSDQLYAFEHKNYLTSNVELSNTKESLLRELASTSFTSKELKKQLLNVKDMLDAEDKLVARFTSVFKEELKNRASDAAWALLADSAEIPQEYRDIYALVIEQDFDIQSSKELKNFLSKLIDQYAFQIMDRLNQCIVCNPYYDGYTCPAKLYCFFKYKIPKDNDWDINVGALKKHLKKVIAKQAGVLPEMVRSVELYAAQIEEVSKVVNNVQLFESAVRSINILNDDIAYLSQVDLVGLIKKNVYELLSSQKLLSCTKPSTEHQSSCKALKVMSKIDERLLRSRKNLKVIGGALDEIKFGNAPLIDDLSDALSRISNYIENDLRPNFISIQSQLEAVRKTMQSNSKQTTSLLQIAADPISLENIKDLDLIDAWKKLKQAKDKASSLAWEEVELSYARYSRIGATYPSSVPPTVDTSIGIPWGKSSSVDTTTIDYLSFRDDITNLYPEQTYTTVRNRFDRSTYLYAFFRQFPAYFHKLALEELDKTKVLNGNQIKDISNIIRQARGWVVGDAHLKNFGTFLPLFTNNSESAPSIGIGATPIIVMNDPDDGGEGSLYIDLLRYFSALDIKAEGELPDNIEELIRSYFLGFSGDTEYVFGQISKSLLAASKTRMGFNQTASGRTAGSHINAQKLEANLGREPSPILTAKFDDNKKLYVKERSTEIKLTQEQKDFAKELIQKFVGEKTNLVDSYAYSRLFGGSGGNLRWEFLVELESDANEGLIKSRRVRNTPVWIEFKFLSLLPASHVASDFAYADLSHEELVSSALKRYRMNIQAGHGAVANPSYMFEDTPFIFEGKPMGPTMIRFRFDGQEFYPFESYTRTEHFIETAKDQLYTLGLTHRRGLQMLGAYDSVSPIWTKFLNADHNQALAVYSEHLANQFRLKYQMLEKYDETYHPSITELRANHSTNKIRQIDNEGLLTLHEIATNPLPPTCEEKSKGWQRKDFIYVSILNSAGMPDGITGDYEDARIDNRKFDAKEVTIQIKNKNKNTDKYEVEVQLELKSLAIPSNGRVYLVANKLAFLHRYGVPKIKTDDGRELSVDIYELPKLLNIGSGKRKVVVYSQHPQYGIGYGERFLNTKYPSLKKQPGRVLQNIGRITQWSALKDIDQWFTTVTTNAIMSQCTS